MTKLILLVGNPGTGKSSLLNALHGSAEFKAGVSIGRGLTSEAKVVRRTADTFLVDTPGLEDVHGRQRAAEEITKALKRGGRYSVFFVVTLEAGRPRPADVVTMKLVLAAAPITDYGILVNKVSGNMMKKLRPPTDSQGSAGYRELLALLQQGVKPGTHRVELVPEVADLVDSDDAVWNMPVELRHFIEDFPGTLIEPSDVTGVDATDYDQKLAEQEALIAQLLHDRVAMAQAVAELHKQELGEAERSADMRVKVEALQRREDQLQRETEAFERAASEAVEAAAEARRKLAERASQMEADVATASEALAEAQKAAEEAQRRLRAVEDLQRAGGLAGDPAQPLQARGADGAQQVEVARREAAEAMQLVRQIAAQVAEMAQRSPGNGAKSTRG